MKLLILILISLLLAVFIGSYAEHDAGQMIVTISGWTVQTTFRAFVIALVISFLFLHYTIRMINKLWRMPKELNHWQENRHHHLAEKHLSQGLMSLVEGDWNKAESSLLKGAPHTQTPLVNLLGAARAAQQLGEIERRDEYLLQAYKHDPDSEIAIGLVQAELQIKQNQTEQALATLTHLHEQKPKHKQVKKMLLHAYAESQDWGAVLELLPKVERAGVITKEEVQAKSLEAYAGRLRTAGDKALESEFDAKSSLLDELWGSIPRNLRHHFYLIEVYSEEKIKVNDSAVCEPLIRKALKKRWDVALLNLYGLVDSKDSAKQLSYAENFLNSHARDANLLLTLGRLCARNTLWGKARTYLEESVEIEPKPETFKVLATVLEELGEKAAASVYYQKGLDLATVSPLSDSVKLLPSN